MTEEQRVEKRRKLIWGLLDQAEEGTEPPDWIEQILDGPWLGGDRDWDCIRESKYCQSSMIRSVRSAGPVGLLSVWRSRPKSAVRVTFDVGAAEKAIEAEWDDLETRDASYNLWCKGTLMEIAGLAMYRNQKRACRKVLCATASIIEHWAGAA